MPFEQAINKEEHRSLIRDAGARGCVLLKNANDTLPISRDKIFGKRVALLGFAKTTLAHGRGITYDTDIGLVVDLVGNAGWTQLAFDPDTLGLISTTHGLPVSSLAPFSGETEGKIVEIVCDLTPKQTGLHYFGISGVGPTQAFVGEELVGDQKDHTPDALGFNSGLRAKSLTSFNLTTGKTYRLRIRTLPCAAGVPPVTILKGRPAFRSGMAVPAEHDADVLSEAVKLAQAADYAVVFTVHTEQWETEGQDQVSFHLQKDGSQDALVTAVAAVNPQTIVVNSTGVPVAMPWLDNVAAVVQV
ncbi:hypothetical protein ACHAQH_005343 [Verticillium albo-atrum]